MEGSGLFLPTLILRSWSIVTHLPLQVYLTSGQNTTYPMPCVRSPIGIAHSPQHTYTPAHLHPSSLTPHTSVLLTQWTTLHCTSSISPYKTHLTAPPNCTLLHTTPKSLWCAGRVGPAGCLRTPGAGCGAPYGPISARKPAITHCTSRPCCCSTRIHRGETPISRFYVNAALLSGITW